VGNTAQNSGLISTALGRVLRQHCQHNDKTVVLRHNTTVRHVTE